ncbi:MAG: VOC family protein [Chlorogloeopsis fritschii C42_A2020_084]|uniref:VOC family protein n=1 Tax=Chlorogloeopsis fritschii TaxID=1124 RepID=UPI0019F34B47|nr:VOC family protein [Chlorogloeopsis fritschii]MBF2007472.1 VOC family protein [Chlorogloeopsis fritschii C42_A2020_084]
MKFNRNIAKTLLLASVGFAVAFTPHNYALSQIERRQDAPSTVITQNQTTQQAVAAVDSVGMTVSDMDKAVEFYSQVLSFKKISDVEVWGTEYEHLQGLFGVRMRVVRMQLGDESIELTEYLTPKGRPIPVDSRSNDRWFQHIAIVVSDMDKAYQRLRSLKVQHASTAPQRLPDWNQAAAGIRAFYFKDPDGHNLEIIYFPPGKGDRKWQKSTNQLFLGIDHTAIVVSNTEASLKFYRDLLGLKLAGESENYGTEQEYLNNVFGARLHISGMRSPNVPGIEFLEYLTPRDGRPFPVDARANDLLHWQTTLVVKDVQAVAQRLRLSKSAFVSSGVVRIAGERLGFKKGFLVRDPDGHVMRIVER